MRTRHTGYTEPGQLRTSVQSVHLYWGKETSKQNLNTTSPRAQNKVMEYRPYPISSQLQIDSLSRWWRNYRSWNRVLLKPNHSVTLITKARSSTQLLKPKSVEKTLVQRDPTQNLFDRHNFSAKVDSVVIPWDEKISNFTPIPFVRSLHCIYEKFKPTYDAKEMRFYHSSSISIILCKTLARDIWRLTAVGESILT